MVHHNLPGLSQAIGNHLVQIKPGCIITQVKDSPGSIIMQYLSVHCPASHFHQSYRSITRWKFKIQISGSRIRINPDTRWRGFGAEHCAEPIRVMQSFRFLTGIHLEKAKSKYHIRHLLQK